MVQLLAVDRDQAKVCFGYMTAFFEMPMLAKMVRRITADSIELKNNLTIEITTNDKRRVRGRTVVAAIFDEVAHWRNEASANPDEDVYWAIQPATLTIPNALMIGISSPVREARAVMAQVRRSLRQARPCPGGTGADVGDESDGLS